LKKKAKKLVIKRLIEKPADFNGDDFESGHWIIDRNNSIIYIGPYDTRAEAKEDLIGLERFWNED